MKMIDGMEDEADEPWHACTTGWCAAVDHVSLSLVNSALPNVFTPAQVEQLCAEHDTIDDFMVGLEGLSANEY